MVIGTELGSIVMFGYAVGALEMMVALSALQDVLPRGCCHRAACELRLPFETLVVIWLKGATQQ